MYWVCNRLDRAARRVARRYGGGICFGVEWRLLTFPFPVAGIEEGEGGGYLRYPGQVVLGERGLAFTPKSVGWNIRLLF